MEEIINQIRALHRRRRFALKTQQKVTLSLESYIRRNATEWRPDLGEAERAKIRAKVRSIIKAARNSEEHELYRIIHVSDAAYAPSAALRYEDERDMERLAKKLPVWPWVESIPGAGPLGLATIVAECGNLSNYATVSKVWKRLGYAPYDGLAGSTWKRPSWRTRTLTADEWIAHPFSGEKYALMHQIASWLWVKQWIGKAKSPTGVGMPNGTYGNVYATRRARTTITHPDWSDGHLHADALRITMKSFLKDLWVEWHHIEATPSRAELPQLAAAE